MSRKSNKLLVVGNAKEKTGIHYTLKHTGKMAGMMSLSTSCTCNPFCQEYSRDPKKICSHCYAQRQMKIYNNLELCLAKNTEILTSRVLKKEEIPLINATYFRFEAFGDIQSVIQVENYFNICKANPLVRFALWIKNPGIIENAISLGNKKPRNLQIVLSSHYINAVASKTRYGFVDKVFSVYDKNFARENGVVINCGTKHCLECGLCYRAGGPEYINELLK